MNFRKLLTIGLSTATAATLTLGVTALPAQANAQSDVCATMPNKLILSSAQVTIATNNLTAANTDLTAKRTALDASMVAWMTAFGDYVLASDGGVPATIAAAKTAFETAQAAVGPKATAWGNSQLAQWNAVHAADLATIVHAVNLTLKNKLGCA